MKKFAISYRDKRGKYKMTPELERLLGKIDRDIKNNKNIVGPFSTSKEANEYLDSL